MLILSGQSPIPWVHCLRIKNWNGRREDQGDSSLAKASINLDHSVVFGFCQLLPAIYQEL